MIEDKLLIVTPALEGKLAKMQLETKMCIHDGHNCRMFGKKQYCVYHLTEEHNPPHRCKYLIYELVYVKKGNGFFKLSMPYYGCVRPRRKEEDSK